MNIWSGEIFLGHRRNKNRKINDRKWLKRSITSVKKIILVWKSSFLVKVSWREEYLRCALNDG